MALAILVAKAFSVAKQAKNGIMFIKMNQGVWNRKR